MRSSLLDTAPVGPPRLALSIGPNPVSSVASITCDLPWTGPVELSIYSLDGRCVADLVNGFQRPGRQSIRWRCAEQAAGIYFCRLRAGGQTIT